MRPRRVQKRKLPVPRGKPPPGRLSPTPVAPDGILGHPLCRPDIPPVPSANRHATAASARQAGVPNCAVPTRRYSHCRATTDGPRSARVQPAPSGRSLPQEKGLSVGGARCSGCDGLCEGSPSAAMGCMGGSRRLVRSPKPGSRALVSLARSEQHGRPRARERGLAGGPVRKSTNSCRATRWWGDRQPPLPGGAPQGRPWLPWPADKWSRPSATRRSARIQSG